MITNERELAVVRNQLALAEGALETIHREVKPTNPAMYNLMAGGYIDMITCLRSEIDAYLGIETQPIERSRLADERQLVEVRGVIRSVDLDNQVFVLRERPEGAPDLPCNYEQSLEEDVKASLDCLVLVAGTLTINRKNKHQMMDAESLEVIRPLPDPDEESRDQSLETASSATPNGKTLD